MKQNIKLILGAIAFFALTFLACEDDDNTVDEIVSLSEARVYFNVESVSVDRTTSQPFSVELRYEGPRTNQNIEIPYTVSFPSENNAVEGEDFKLPKTGSFVIKKGSAITNVVLLQQVLDNENADENRSLIFELQPNDGIMIGSPSNNGNSITITMESHKPIDPNDPEDFIGDKKFTFTAGTSTYKIPYFSTSKDIKNTSNDLIKRAVIAVHGSGHTADSQLERMLGAANMETNNLDTILIVAPQFIGDDEITAFKLDEEHLYWSGLGWRTGDDSEDSDTFPREDQVSSFSVMDSIMLTLSEYPNLETIVLSGHSAGGQFTARYAVSSPMPDDLIARGINISFVVNNPGTYTYMDDTRKVLGTENTYAVPSAAALSGCPDYNVYQFGLEDIHPYLEIVGVDGIRNRLQERKVTYLIGQNDNDPSPEETSINTQCEAILQGRDRFERAQNYFGHLLDFYGTSILDNQKIEVVPGVGHSSEGMYQSEIGRRNTFRN